MSYHALRMNANSFINPIWFNQLRHSHKVGIVTSFSTVDVEGVVLRIVEPEKASLSIGEKVIVKVAGDFYFETMETYNLRQQEKQAYEEQSKKAEALRQQAEAQKEEKKRQASADFYASYNLPFAYRADIKVVLSGLTEHSFGNGMNKRTVYHLMLLESYEEGRFKRDADNFLCTTSSTDDGHFDDHRYADKYDYPPIVTCKKCIKIMEKWRKK